jgi:hypothetical protein
VRKSSLKSNIQAIDSCRFTLEELELLRQALIRQSPPADALA